MSCLSHHPVILFLLFPVPHPLRIRRLESRLTFSNTWVCSSCPWGLPVAPEHTSCLVRWKRPSQRPWLSPSRYFAQPSRLQLCVPLVPHSPQDRPHLFLQVALVVGQHLATQICFTQNSWTCSCLLLPAIPISLWRDPGLHPWVTFPPLIDCSATD